MGRLDLPSAERRHALASGPGGLEAFRRALTDFRCLDQIEQAPPSLQARPLDAARLVFWNPDASNIPTPRSVSSAWRKLTRELPLTVGRSEEIHFV